MINFATGYIFALACALIVIIGDTLLKLAADKGHGLASMPLAVGCALYAISAVAWFLAMRHISLAQAGVAYAMFSLLALCVIGSVFFGERISWREVGGIGCAMAAIVLMVR
ncbi:EamA family transporter [Psychromarinibacter sp. S121]|uniref:EamA family transporter n=1 Tax=Psychromarinibacter sp. S121 TaxID=3415127 RepID=UPI003C7D3990